MRLAGSRAPARSRATADASHGSSPPRSVRTYVEGLKETSAALLDLIAANGIGSGEAEEGAAEDSGKGKKKLLYEDVRRPPPPSVPPSTPWN